MYILAVETTGAFASVALLKDDTLIGHVQGHDRFSHLQNLMPQIQGVIKENKITVKDIDVIAVSCGPGSFTGIRIGVSSARALSQILEIPSVPVSSLEALALRTTEASDITWDEETLICPILDARRSQVYGAGYFVKNGKCEEVVEAAPYTLEEFLEKVASYKSILLLGDGADAYGEKITLQREAETLFAPEEIMYQDAVTVARIGKKVYEEKGGISYGDLKPVYMRIAEAERKLKEKQQKG